MSSGLQSARSSKPPSKSRDALRMICCISATDLNFVDGILNQKTIVVTADHAQLAGTYDYDAHSSQALPCIGRFKNVRSSPGLPVAVNDQPRMHVIGTQCAALVNTFEPGIQYGITCNRLIHDALSLQP